MNVAVADPVIALGHRTAVDGQLRQVVVQDREHALGVRDRRVRRAAQVHEHVSSASEVVSPMTVIGIGDRRHARRERQRAGRGDVVRSGGRCAVRRRVVHRDG